MRQPKSNEAVRASLLAVAGLPADALPSAERGKDEKKDYMIPMRDGVRLHTEVWTERGATGALPFLIMRSPYGWKGAKDLLERSLRDMVSDGYIWVDQDIRGRYQSEGRFVMLPPVRDKNDPRPSTRRATPPTQSSGYLRTCRIIMDGPASWESPTVAG